jgi:macrolide phosphotransferase
VRVTRSPLALAALASAAVPGLDPTSVEATGTAPGQQFEIAFVQDSEHRRWVVRAPLTPAAGAQMDVTVALLALLARRLPYAVPTPKGFAALKGGGRVAVYPYLPGRPLDLRHLPAGPGLAAEVGRAIAALHNVDLRLFEEAGLPAYDADTYRTRRLAELDRAAATGHVPTGLLTRWERALEEVALWRFAPTPTHGDLTGEQVLAVFDDEQDASSGRVKAITGWEDAKVADPADDFATLIGAASPEAFDSVMEAYAQARVERPDKHLERRARLAHELQLVSGLLAATSAGEAALVDAFARRLQRLEDATYEEQPPASAVRPSHERVSLPEPAAAAAQHLDAAWTEPVAAPVPDVEPRGGDVADPEAREGGAEPSGTGAEPLTAGAGSAEPDAEHEQPGWTAPASRPPADG